MNESEKRYYFSTIKLCCIIILIIYFVSNSMKSLQAVSVEWFLLAVTLLAALGFELADTPEKEERKSNFDIKNWIFKRKKKFFFLCAEFILMVILLVFFGESNNGLFLLPLVLLDTIVFFHLSFVLSLLSLIGVLFFSANIYLYIIYCFFLIIIYFQNFIIINKYKKYLEDFEQEEYQLKDSIHSKDTIYRERLEKSSLTFENEMLEEKTRLSQALHDKLGHSINGSIYQLEACKVLMAKEPLESSKIMQGVIDNLRTSMDEIRMILRREKPDKKRMAYLQLVQLCQECKTKYGIQADVKIEGENKEIPELFWDIILDNTIEAVTNALKYAKCTKLSIEIKILHKVIRCSIEDNGVGCDTMKEGMGIQGMKDRARKVNGYIDISSENGFHINMIIPVTSVESL